MRDDLITSPKKASVEGLSPSKYNGEFPVMHFL
jgi:hypothetical protein